MKDKALLFVKIYIVLHLCIAFFGVRYWPFTDYPMFGQAFKKHEEIAAHKLRGVGYDNSTFWLPRSMADYTLKGIQTAPKDLSRKIALVESALAFAKKSNPDLFEKVKAVELVKIRMVRIPNTEKFERYETVEYTFSI
ncbi:MAG: hypothetical protein H6623_02595 [Bdellovibrionaceae bacterium]|nr:hypothetical protein [Pseudobdellovibrionaceae bacterium]